MIDKLKVKHLIYLRNNIFNLLHNPFLIVKFF